MFSFIITVRRALEFILSPPRCCACKKFLDERVVFCRDCDRTLLPIASVPFRVTATKNVMVHAACKYEEPVRALVVKKRTGSVSGSYALAELIWQKTVFKNISCDVIVPVPLHWKRLLVRGFNQAREMGELLAHKKKCACVELLKRVKSTAYQADLPVNLRAANVQDAFVLKRVAQQYCGKNIVLLDDVMTTGSTLRGAAKLLLQLKPASLTIVVACRAPVAPLRNLLRSNVLLRNELLRN